MTSRRVIQVKPTTANGFAIIPLIRNSAIMKTTSGNITNLVVVDVNVFVLISGGSISSFFSGCRKW